MQITMAACVAGRSLSTVGLPACDTSSVGNPHESNDWRVAITTAWFTSSSSSEQDDDFRCDVDRRSLK